MTEASKTYIKLRKLLPWAAMAATAALVGIYLWTHSASSDEGRAEQVQAQQAVIPEDIKPAVSTNGELPNEADFEQVAESETLVLYADKNTGHFKIRDKRDGHELRSYPNPEDWPLETISGTWRSHLLSPIMLETFEIALKTEVKVSSLLSLNGGIMSWKPIEDGFAVTFAMPSIQMAIPIEVRLRNDYVETKVIDAELIEGKDSLINLKVYPFLGAEQPRGQEGYLLLPDGSGAIYKFKENISNDRSVYREPIYGIDSAFNSVYTNRKPITMPVYGIKSGSSAFLAVVDEGEEYGYMYAAPAGVYSRYAWATVEHNYRLQYFQPTTYDKLSGFFTYSKIKFGGDRKIRYYVLPESESDYSGMAAKYRNYLMKEKGLQKQEAGPSELPLYLDLIGADSEKGFLRNRYITGTTTDEAKSILDRLHAQGIPRLVVTYQGWQTGSASRIGFGTKVDKRLGGNDGMRSFAEYAKSKGDTVLLQTDFTLNTDGDDFDPKRQAMQDQAGSIMKFPRLQSNDEIAIVSPKVSLDKMDDALKSFSSLGVDGLQLSGTGYMLFSDYNRRYRTSREEAASLQSELLNTVQSKLPAVTVTGGNAYALQGADAVRQLAGDYSYDLFLDEAVPFAQMALHGLVPYTMNWGNARDEYRKDFLRSIEYGAAPTFGVMHAKTEKMKRAYTIWQYSLNYEEWEAEIIEEYKRFNEALGDVQGQFMTYNRTVAPKVKESVYSNGKRIIVNYNDTEVTVEGRRIPAQDFVVVKGGEAQ
ncbi:DUF5696 domain-containing protein [Paenibacillus sp. LHD-38]|uniref:DUF5696 domain-containing protein n=1 Tax=Paenibacillus sp. LHD-38 TaxID=3072143 RepID=UPI00280D9485|nr:DUF5696 domain-containing protein [Paenibacillus sp. LHD-38]MDQ8737972.1 DUF5696 domain-containing protein [Paenibacillus sp. LHD-38]